MMRGIGERVRIDIQPPSAALSPVFSLFGQFKDFLFRCAIGRSREIEFRSRRR